MNTVFTIGQSTHEQDYFIHLLEQNRITALCDVRSTPYSRQNPQFNRESLERALLAQGINYRFLGKELGARSDNPSCYQNGKVQYARLAETELFKQGTRRILRGLREKFRIVLMCAEKEPLDCHRAILIAPQLIKLQVRVEHIHSDGRVEDHESAIRRLMGMFNLLQADMFSPQEQVLTEAYHRQEERIAYDLNRANTRILTAGIG